MDVGDIGDVVRRSQLKPYSNDKLLCFISFSRSNLSGNVPYVPNVPGIYIHGLRFASLLPFRGWNTKKHGQEGALPARPACLSG